MNWTFREPTGEDVDGTWISDNGHWSVVPDGTQEFVAWDGMWFLLDKDDVAVARGTLEDMKAEAEKR